MATTPCTQGDARCLPFVYRETQSDQALAGTWRAIGGQSHPSPNLVNAASHLPPFEPRVGHAVAGDRATGAFDVTVAPSGDSFRCAADESLLRGMLRLGRRGIPVGCVGGGCGICKVRILAGQVMPLGPVSRAHVSADDEAAGVTLACRVAPATALRVEAVGYLISKFEQPALATHVRKTNSTTYGDK
jgi:ferredoxin